MKRMVLYPRFLNEFRCIGSKCEDTCCTGWRVDLDKPTFKKYKNLKRNSFTLKIQQNIKRNKNSLNESRYGFIKMNECGSCPFLTSEKLCGVQLNYGEDYLSNVCKTFPRSYKMIDNLTEKAASLSCPEIARLALLDPRPMEFEQTVEEGDEDFPISRYIEINNEKKLSVQDYFWDLRMWTIQILQNRSYTIPERLIILGLTMKKIQELIEKNDVNRIPTILENQRSLWENVSELKQKVKRIPHDSQLLITISRLLLQSKLTTTGAGEKYYSIFKQTIQGLGMDDETVNIETILGNYKKGMEVYLEPFMDDHDYIFENYLVYYVYSEWFPIQYDNVFEDYIMLVIHYALLKIHIIGMANDQKKININDFNKIVQLTSKEIDHNHGYILRVREFLKSNNLGTMAYMSVLIVS